MFTEYKYIIHGNVSKLNANPDTVLIVVNKVPEIIV